MKALIGLMDKPAKTGFEKFILNVHPYKRTDLFEYQATKLVFQHQLKEALDKFKECEGSGDGSFLGDPFLIHINDCHDCDHAAAKEETYSKYSFIDQMLSLEEKTSHKPKEAAEAYFLLGNGYYNITYFGNGRSFYENAIKPNEVLWEFSSSYANFKDVIYDCSLAEECYRKAMELSVDPEFKAKCCFMAAKCEQNVYFISGNNDKADFKAGNYFKMLKDKFAKTDYYKDVINECGYFKTYVRRK
jgi:tetratricopeptide (TPR) repeat protein